MKAWQFVLSFIIASLVVLFAVLSEYDYFLKIDKIQNPFEDELDSNQILKIEETGLIQDLFLNTGEFLRVFAGGSINFTTGRREIFNGEVFLSSHLISDQDRTFARSSIQLPFNFDNFNPRVAQYKVGNIIINNPTGIVFVKRDAETQTSEIYAYDQEIELYFDEANHPFILPPRHKVVIKEKLVTNVLAKLFYSKQIKEFRMKDYKVPFFDTTAGISAKTIPEKIISSINRENQQWYNSFKNYARALPAIWFKKDPNSYLGKFSFWISKIQSKVAIGYSDELRVKLKFQELVLDFSKAYFYINSNNLKEAENYLKKFAKIYDKTEWKQFFLGNNIYNKNWKQFEKAQKSWLRTIFSDSQEQPFVDFWLSLKKVESINLLEESYSLIQHYRSLQEYKEVKKRVLVLMVELKKLELSRDDRFKVTKIRRLLGRMLYDTVAFHEKIYFDFYRELVVKEIFLYEGTGEEKYEITLENGYEVLNFIKKFLSEKYKQTSLNLDLKNLFNYLDITTLTEERGTNVFSKSQMSLISLIESGQSLDDREDLMAEERERENLSNILSSYEYTDEEEDEDEEVEIKKIIFDEDSLLTYLEKFEIDVSQMNVRLLGKSGLLRFSRGRYKSNPVSGSFDLNDQIFKVFTVGKIKHRKVSTFFMKGIMFQITEELVADKNIDNVEFVDQDFIVQDSVKAVIEREIVFKQFSKLGFSLDFKNIKKLDNNELGSFEITKVILDNEYELSFDYSYETKLISNLFIQQGKNDFQFEDNININDLSETIYDKMDELYAN